MTASSDDLSQAFPSAMPLSLTGIERSTPHSFPRSVNEQEKCQKSGRQPPLDPRAAYKHLENSIPSRKAPILLLKSIKNYLD
jgi:hypothetical protein